MAPEPETLEQLSWKVLDSCTARIEIEPLTPFAPLHEPDAWQLVALVEPHCTMMFSPALIKFGLALTQTETGCFGGGDTGLAAAVGWLAGVLSAEAAAGDGCGAADLEAVAGESGVLDAVDLVSDDLGAGG